MKRPEWLNANFYGDRIRWQVGDLLAATENETGEKTGKRFSIDLALADHVGEFDDETYNLPHVLFDGRESNRGWNEAESHYYLSYSILMLFWRWGINVIWRGREIGRFEWSLPDEDDETPAAAAQPEGTQP